jgi:hypothetical protein
MDFGECYADGGEVKPDKGMMETLRAFMMAHNGVGGADNREADLAMNVDNSSGTYHDAGNYSDGGGIPDLAMLTGGDIPPTSFDVGNNSTTYRTGGNIPPPPPMPAMPMRPPVAMPPTPSPVAPPPVSAPPMPGRSPLGGASPAAASPAPGTDLNSILGAAQDAGSQVMGAYTPEKRAEMLAYLAQKQNGMPYAIGNSLASVGDAITRGLGHSQSNFLNDTLGREDANRKEGMEAFDQGAKSKLQQTQAGLEMEKMTASSPLARAKQAAFAPLLAQAGLSRAQAANIAPEDIKDVASLAAEMGNKRLAVQLEMTNQMLDRANKAAEDYRSDPEAAKIREKIQAIDTALPLLPKAAGGDGAAKDQLHQVLAKNELGNTWGVSDMFRGDFSRGNAYKGLSSNLAFQRQQLMNTLDQKRTALMGRATAETRLPPSMISTLFQESTPDISHKAAIQWAQANPKDPRSASILATASNAGGGN